MHFFRTDVLVVIQYNYSSFWQCCFCDFKHGHYIVKKIGKKKRESTLGGMRNQVKLQERLHSCLLSSKAIEQAMLQLAL